ncbi:caspase family protein [Clostridium hydrogeniformans]|uniref:caspase family protein n=1 Tax=Clostridium hydrogeniformans TaxID=349933 RepID=UPI00048112F3|nr:caspase family protein [Clostridium hydrogeniformans]
MTKGISLHIGLNSIDPKVYGGNGALKGCENDANSMSNIAKYLKYNETKVLLTESATKEAVINEIKRSAEALDEGDIFFLSYSGHGGQIKDLNNDEDDSYDETWCLYNGQLLDDELYSLWQSFKADVRIILLSDSCHSGTISKAENYNLPKGRNSTDSITYRFLPREFTQGEYEINRDKYSNISKPNKNNLQCTVKLISGCQDNQLSSDGDVNGLFTEKLLKVWNNGTFNRDYRRFHKEIVRLMPPDQTPMYSNIGKVNDYFERQKPFNL